MVTRLLGRLIWVLGATGAPTAAQPSHQPPAVTVAGQGPETYVLISGLVGGVAGFRRLEERLLAREFRVIVIDPYQLSIDSADVSFAAMARRVDATLAAYGVEGARVVGHGVGAGVALRLAANQPHRVSALYFLEAGALARNYTGELSVALRLVPLIARMPFGRDFIRGRYLGELRRNSFTTQWLDSATRRDYIEPVIAEIDRVIALGIRLSRAREPESLPTIVARIHVPVTVVIGAFPHPSGASHAELEGLVPLGGLVRIVRIRDAGHFVHEEAPDAVATQLLPPREVARVSENAS